MTDRPTLTAELDAEHARILDAAAKLNAQARDDLASAVAPSVSLEGTVSGTANSSPTETGLQALRGAGQYRDVVGKFRHVANQLEHLWDELNPRPTGQTCPTTAIDNDGELVRCEGQVTHQGRCWECHDFLKRARRNPEASLLADWNARRPKPCACGPDCCPQDDDGHTTCRDRAADGRTVSERCHKRRVRRSEAQRALSEPGR